MTGLQKPLEEQDGGPELLALIGRRVLVPVGSSASGCDAWATVEAVSRPFGCWQLLVRPVSGVGSCWVRVWKVADPMGSAGGSPG